jgi:hypothetical protein
MQCIGNHGARLTARNQGGVGEKPILARRREVVQVTQKPSSARPTQLNANIEQMTVAQVAIVFADSMTKTLWRRQSNSVQRLVLNNGESSPR